MFNTLDSVKHLRDRHKLCGQAGANTGNPVSVHSHAVINVTSDVTHLKTPVHHTLAP